MIFLLRKQFFEKIITGQRLKLIVLNPFLDSLCNFGFKNIGLTPGIPKECFEHPQDVVFSLNVKFIYSEKATNICEIFPLLLIVCTVVKSEGKISQNFGAFSEYTNFNKSWQWIMYTVQTLISLEPKGKFVLKMETQCALGTHNIKSFCPKSKKFLFVGQLMYTTSENCINALLEKLLFCSFDNGAKKCNMKLPFSILFSLLIRNCLVIIDFDLSKLEKNSCQNAVGITLPQTI